MGRWMDEGWINGWMTGGWMMDRHSRGGWMIDTSYMAIHPSPMITGVFDAAVINNKRHQILKSRHETQEEHRN